MNVEEVVLTTTEAMSLKAINNHVEYKTNIEFLKAHKGLRNKKVHMLLGAAGSGKSTLARTILLDFVKNNPTKKVFLLLSEESVVDLKTELQKTGFNLEEGSNIFTASELDNEFRSETDFFISLEESIKSCDADLFFYDNVTTSKLYNDRRPKEQSDFMHKIKKLTTKLGVATFLIAHTRAEVTDNYKGMLTENDVRGNKSVTNITQFLYLYQRFQIDEYFYPTIIIKKHRSQDPESRMFRLVFNKHKCLFEKDISISFKEFKEAYDNRDKL